MKKLFWGIIAAMTVLTLFYTSVSANDAQYLNADSEASLLVFDNGKKGIDVSSHQNIIDWEKVKAAGIEFAIIRCGFGDDLTQYDDVQWERNASECERLGIPYGAYLYSYAASTQEAYSEAAHAIRLLKGHNLQLPVFWDAEDKDVAACSNDLIGQMAYIFCSSLQDAGYEVGVYASLSWWNTRLTSDVFNDPSWYKWVAQWSSQCTYVGEYTFWQYTDSGHVDGIGNVDMDIMYSDIVKADGDINGDGRTDAGDAGMILRYRAGIIEFSPADIKKGDINGDGRTDMDDAVMILRSDAGM